LAEAPFATPPTPAEPLPEAPVVPLHPLAEPSSPAPGGATPNAPLAPLPDAHPADLAHHAPIAAATATTPEAASPPGPLMHFCCAVGNSSLSFRACIKYALYNRRRLSRGCRSFFRRFLLQSLPPRYWCYAARASPS